MLGKEKKIICLRPLSALCLAAKQLALALCLLAGTSRSIFILQDKKKQFDLTDEFNASRI